MSQPSHQAPEIRSLRLADWLLGLAMLLPAIPVGLYASALRHGVTDRASAATLALMPIAGYGLLVALIGLGSRRVRRDPGSLALLGAWVGACVALAIYVTWVQSLVQYPADILTWSEGPFVQDIVRLRAGLPLYSDPEALESFFYTPLTQVVTWLAAGAVGHPLSIPLFRTIQLLWIALASGVVVLIVAELRLLAAPMQPAIFPERHPRLGAAFIAAMAFLVGTNPLTSSFAHNLHNDSLAVLVCTAAFWLMLRYARSRRSTELVLLACVPAVGFLVKQNLAIWAPLLTIAIALLGGPRWLRRSASFGVASFGLLGAVVAGGALLWGDPWWYWIFTALRNHGTSPLRAVQHAMEAWCYLALGLAGGMMLIRTAAHRSLMVAWLVWLALFLTEALTSGIAWMLNHMAPGSMIAGAWALAAIVSAWDRVTSAPGEGALSRALRLGRTAGWGVAMLLLIAALTQVRMPVDGLPPDAERYRLAVEDEVQAALGADRPVLLDHGAWLFAPAGISVGDRAATVGELGVSGSSRFTGLLARIHAHHYGTILVRDYDLPTFNYDYRDWPRSSGIREALQQEYRVVRVIPGVMGGTTNPFFGPITVLIPREDGPGPTDGGHPANSEESPQ